ncbi:MAG: YitT family protein [Shimia sp.]
MAEARHEPHSPATEHSWLEDVQAFLVGGALVALSLHMLTHLGLITGQTAGLAVLVSYASGWSFGWVFFAVNLPFYLLAWARMGPRFTIKTFVAVGLVSVMTEAMPLVVTFEAIAPLPGALIAGAAAGLGLIVFFRHGASLGGVGILALWLQDRIGVQAGWVQLAFDAVLFAAAFAVIPPRAVAYALAGAVVVNLVIALNHRKDRYIGR